VRRIGYAPSAFHALVPARGVLEINVALRARPTPLERVSIRAAVPIRGLDDEERSAADRSLTIAAVRNHPLLAEPDVLHALSGGDVRARPESPAGVHVRGSASDHVAHFIDGIPVFSPYHAAGTFSAWNPDALSRVELHTSAPPPVFTDALAGAIVATTRSDTPQHEVQGSLSTTEARLTSDGPGPRVGSGYLLSARSTFPGFLSRSPESSYLRNESGDVLAKVESPLAGGRLRLLGYASANEISVALDTTASDGRRGLEWSSRSLGADWVRPIRKGPLATTRATLHMRAWSALSDASAAWQDSDSAAEQLSSLRRDIGVLLMLSLSGSDGTRPLTAGLRTQRILTRYASRLESASARTARFDSSVPLTTAFVTYALPVRSHTRLDLALAATGGGGSVNVSPRAQLRFQPNAQLTLGAAFSRLQQYAQSLRNPESMVGNIFPVDVYVAAGDGRIPIARSEQAALTTEYRPTPGTRIAAHGYARRFVGLALVAPRESAPFATSDFVQGGGRARGLAIDGGAHGSRFALLASYGLQHVRFDYSDTSYVPFHGATHGIDAGVIAFPSPTVSLKLGVTSELGRRTTAVRGPFEWEACNLLDRGCEFAGSPHVAANLLGATRLPTYVRIDFAARKHWHMRVAGRDALLGAFAAVTNLLNRRNLLTVIEDPATRRRRGVDMLPLAPLVFGIDWRY
jgi:hypothetical protein